MKHWMNIDIRKVRNGWVMRSEPNPGYVCTDEYVFNSALELGAFIAKFCGEAEKPAGNGDKT